jgi:hypothetical protein
VAGSDTGSGWIRRLAPRLLSTVVVGLASTFTPFLERHIVDEVIRADGGSLTPWLIGLLALAVVISAASAARRYLTYRVVLNAQDLLRAKVHGRLQHTHYGGDRDLPRAPHRPADRGHRPAAFRSHAPRSSRCASRCRTPGPPPPPTWRPGRWWCPWQDSNLRHTV